MSKPETAKRPVNKPKTAHQRAEEKRKEKLAEIDEQIKEGTLVIRKMTAAERKRFPPRPAAEKKTRRSR